MGFNSGFKGLILPAKEITSNWVNSHRKNQQDATVYQNLLFQCFLIAQHVSGDKPPIIRSSKTVIAASGFTYVFGCRPLRWLGPKHVEQLRNIGIINSTTQSHLVGSFYEIYITINGSMNIKWVNSLFYGFDAWFNHTETPLTWPADVPYDTMQYYNTDNYELPCNFIVINYYT